MEQLIKPLISRAFIAESSSGEEHVSNGNSSIHYRSRGVPSRAALNSRNRLERFLFVFHLVKLCFFFSAFFFFSLFFYSAYSGEKEKKSRISRQRSQKFSTMEIPSKRMRKQRESLAIRKVSLSKFNVFERAAILKRKFFHSIFLISGFRSHGGLESVGLRRNCGDRCSCFFRFTLFSLNS